MRCGGAIMIGLPRGNQEIRCMADSSPSISGFSASAVTSSMGWGRCSPSNTRCALWARYRWGRFPTDPCAPVWLAIGLTSVTPVMVLPPMAVALLADWALTDPFGPVLHRLEIAILPDNARSLAVVRKVGAHHEGLRERYMYVNGQWRDHVTFALLAEDAGQGFANRLASQNLQ